jgi:hypothetical protein
VLATITHLSSQIVELRIGDEPPLYPTATHPLYSLDRHDWVAVGNVQPGERLATRRGGSVVRSLQALPDIDRVYNLEVENDHSYLVGPADLVSHNANPCATPVPSRAGATIHDGQQGKHVPGHNNFLPAAQKSEFTHPDPQGLLDKHAGTGIQYPPNKEVVDFKEDIGVYVDRTTGTREITQRGTIHYNAKNQAHIVPASPNPQKGSSQSPAPAPGPISTPTGGGGTP